MGNTQQGGGGRMDGNLQRPGSRRLRGMSETQRVAAEVLPIPDGPPMVQEDPPESPQSPKAGECPVVFRWSFGTTSQPRQVSITGSWDRWHKRIPMVKSTADFSTIVDLEPGEYEYKFLVDGQWVVDDTQKKTCNEIGSENNVIQIQEADFAVFEALEQDFHASNAGEVLRGGADSKPSHDTPNDREMEKLRSFTQEVPSIDALRKAPGPPAIPPQLLQVLLNKETPESCDPNVLPEPNHVMLNHMYALSIKDSVMVLSSTQRYRKKFVTTLLYKAV